MVVTIAGGSFTEDFESDDGTWSAWASTGSGAGYANATSGAGVLSGSKSGKMTFARSTAHLTKTIAVESSSTNIHMDFLVNLDSIRLLTDGSATSNYVVMPVRIFGASSSVAEFRCWGEGGGTTRPIIKCALFLNSGSGVASDPIQLQDATALDLDDHRVDQTMRWTVDITMAAGPTAASTTSLTALWQVFYGGSMAHRAKVTGDAGVMVNSVQFGEFGGFTAAGEVAQWFVDKIAIWWNTRPEPMTFLEQHYEVHVQRPTATTLDAPETAYILDKSSIHSLSASWSRRRGDVMLEVEATLDPDNEWHADLSRANQVGDILLKWQRPEISMEGVTDEWKGDLSTQIWGGRLDSFSFDTRTNLLRLNAIGFASMFTDLAVTSDTTYNGRSARYIIDDVAANFVSTTAGPFTSKTVSAAAATPLNRTIDEYVVESGDTMADVIDDLAEIVGEESIRTGCRGRAMFADDMHTNDYLHSTSWGDVKPTSIQTVPIRQLGTRYEKNVDLSDLVNSIRIVGGLKADGTRVDLNLTDQGSIERFGQRRRTVFNEKIKSDAHANLIAAASLYTNASPKESATVGWNDPMNLHWAWSENWSNNSTMGRFWLLDDGNTQPAEVYSEASKGKCLDYTTLSSTGQNTLHGAATTPGPGAGTGCILDIAVGRGVVNTSGAQEVALAGWVDIGSLAGANNRIILTAEKDVAALKVYVRIVGSSGTARSHGPYTVPAVSSGVNRITMAHDGSSTATAGGEVWTDGTLLASDLDFSDPDESPAAHFGTTTASDALDGVILGPVSPKADGHLVEDICLYEVRAFNRYDGTVDTPGTSDIGDGATGESGNTTLTEGRLPRNFGANLVFWWKADVISSVNYAIKQDGSVITLAATGSPPVAEPSSGVFQPDAASGAPLWGADKQWGSHPFVQLHELILDVTSEGGNVTAHFSGRPSAAGGLLAGLERRLDRLEGTV